MKEKLRYGFPISTIIYQIVILLAITLTSFLIALLYQSLFLAIVLLIMLFFMGYMFIINYSITFFSYREIILNKMIEVADLKNNECVLDLGTGSGYIAIGFAKHLDSGCMIGADLFHKKTQDLYHYTINNIKINFLGNTLHNATRNAFVEKQDDKVFFIQTDLEKYFPFKSNCFDLVVSSQFLYCIDPHRLSAVLNEIDRVLKTNGRIVLFESNSFMNWDISLVKDFLIKRGYKVDIIPLEYFSNKSLLVGKK